MNVPDRAAPSQPVSAQQAGELRATLGLLYRRLRQTRAGADLTLPESSALSRLDQHGPATGAQLARIEQVSPQSIGATVQALEAKGLIGRAPDPHDGRRVILSLTAAGRETLRSKRSARTEQMTRALAALTVQERAQLMAVLPVLEHLAQEL
jgi:DNA-binding MarR family transcriptional regulator